MPSARTTSCVASSTTAESSLLLRARPVSEAQWNSSVIIGTDGGRRSFNSANCASAHRPRRARPGGRGGGGGAGDGGCNHGHGGRRGFVHLGNLGIGAWAAARAAR